MYGHWTEEGGSEKGEVWGAFSVLIFANPLGKKWSLKPSSNPNSQFRERKRAKIEAELLGMGYETWLIQDALAATNGSSLTDAVEWIARHLEELARSGDREAVGATASAPAIVENSNVGEGPSQEAIASLAAMGFHEIQATEALVVCQNNVERALEYLLGTQGE